MTLSFKNSKIYRGLKSATSKRINRLINATVYNHESARRLLALADSADYAAGNMAGALASADAGRIMSNSLAVATAQGLGLEFGVWSGRSINRIADHFGSDRQVHGFDSFEGLPEDWVVPYSKGTFDRRGDLPVVRCNVKLHVGWFEKTLPDFVAKNRDSIAFLHVDCDLYSSTKTIFDALGERLVAGSVILFDEYFNYPGWREHEHRAFQELVEARSLKFRWIAYNTSERTSRCKS